MGSDYERERDDYWEAMAERRAELRLERRTADAEYAGEARIYHYPDNGDDPR